MFACLDATGADLRRDGVARFRAFRPDPDGRGDEFEECADPQPGSPNEAAGARFFRRFGISGERLRSSPPVEEVARRFEAVVGKGPVVCFERRRFLPWFERVAPEAAARVVVLGVADLARFLLPGRASADPERVLLALGPGRRFGPAGPGPRDLPSLLAALLGEAQRLPPDAFSLAAALLVELPARFEAKDPAAAEHLRAALELLDRPWIWRPTDGLFDEPLPDGAFRAAARKIPEAARAVEESAPRFAAAGERFDGDPLPTEAKGAVAFDERERVALDLAFSEILPKEFAAESNEADPRPFYRRGQHALANRVADHLERGEFLVVDAPTGTGKTLAYLLPSLLWARRAGVRFAVSTFTRALQEQAYEREVPRALRALRRAGIEGDFRVALLKGRANYLCGRKLRGLAPDGTEDPNEILAWGMAALFYLADPDGDLDRLPAIAPVPTRGDAADGALRRTREEVRAESGCCTRREDRRRCAADGARRAAERAHLVVTNHAFALSTPEFFRHAVFDECEHLHEQAKSAASVEIRLVAVGRLLGEIRDPARPGARGLLREIARGARRVRARPFVEEADAGPGLVAALEEAVEVADRAGDALESFDGEVAAFVRWREREAPRRDERETHALLREYALAERGRAFVETRVAIAQALSALESALALLSEELTLAPVRGVARLRARLGRARTQLAAFALSLEEFLPAPEGAPQFDPAWFVDVEEDPYHRGGFQCARRILLPNEFLGGKFLPPFRSAAFVSAANCLGGSFEAVEAYLGLDRLRAAPHPETGLPGRALDAMRAPGTLDYGRVLLAVPEDAPRFRSDRESRARFLAFVAEFVRFLGVRTGGRLLVLFTSQDDLRRVAGAIEPFFAEAGLPFHWQGMQGAGKEEIAERFRGSDDAVLLGLDTFWFGVDFPGAAVEYVVLVKLPYGRLDRYHWAQRAALGEAEHRRRIYLPRALGMFRQGFGRLLRRKGDRGAVFVLDRRVLEGPGQAFLRELPGLGPAAEEPPPQLVVASAASCVRDALAHMGLLADVERRGLGLAFPD